MGAKSKKQRGGSSLHTTDLPNFDPDTARNARRLIELALAEDLGPGQDLTTACACEPHWVGNLQIVARQSGLLAGAPVVPLVIEAAQLSIRVECLLTDGTMLEPGAVVARLSGPVPGLLSLERIWLNFLGRLSGIATLTQAFVDRIRGTRAKIYDTRKTTPGWRKLEKYAVRVGGGYNHRFGLYDAVLLKDNHLAAWRRAHPNASLSQLLAAVRSRLRVRVPVVIEVESLAQLEDALHGNPEVVLLDNFGADQLRRAVSLRDRIAPNVELEASGGVTLETVRSIAETGVERISVGALTHSARWLDFSADLL
jgi:nicotinate-nucleotide pyrophosphorylase (carboxylating)